MFVLLYACPHVLLLSVLFLVLLLIWGVFKWFSLLRLQPGLKVLQYMPNAGIPFFFFLSPIRKFWLYLHALSSEWQYNTCLPSVCAAPQVPSTQYVVCRTGFSALDDVSVNSSLSTWCFCFVFFFVQKMKVTFWNQWGKYFRRLLNMWSNVSLAFHFQVL